VAKPSEQEQFEQRARESADLSAGIIGSAMDAIVALDDAQRIVLFNAAAEEIFGCPANEAIGSSVERFIPQRFREGHSTRVRRFSESGVTNRTLHSLGKLWGLRANGEEFPIEASISTVTSGDKRFYTAVIRDVTERHRAEEAIRESEQRFRLVADTAPVLMWMSGTDKLCTYFNKPWLDFTGRSVEEELGSGWAEGVHPDDLQRCLQIYSQFFDRREQFEMEYRLRRHDGQYRWILDIGVPRFNQDRSFVGYIGICVDVTERMQAEETVKKSELQYRTIVETTNEGVWLLDSKLHTSYVNRQAAKLLGYEPREMVGRSVLDFYYPEDVEHKKQVLMRRQQGVGEQIEERLRRKDGSELWVRLAATPVFKDSGEFDGALAMMSDITERRLADQQRLLAEQMLRESEQQFRTLAEAIPQLCWMARGDGHIFWYNQRWYTYTGTTPEQMEGWGWQSVHDPRTLPSVLERWKSSISTGEPFDMVFPLRGADGVFHPFLTRVMPMKGADGLVARWFGTNTDVTELRDVQEQLRANVEWLRLAQWAARIGTFDFDIRSGVDTWTPETEALYGLPPGGFDGTLSAFENLVHPDDRQRVMEATYKTITTGEPTEGEWRAVWPDGSVHWIAGRGQLLRDQSGEPWRLIGVNLDITESKRAQEALLGMTRKLVEAQEQERARIARELHDDITQRLALLSIEIDQTQHHPTEISSEVPEPIHQLSNKAREIANDISALSHELHSSKLDFLGIVGGMRSWCREFGERQKLQIDFESHNVPQLPHEISLCLFRVLQEALQNAAKHSGATRIEVRLVESSGEFHLTVSDSGKGFDINAPGQSRGLGLTSMQERVRLVGGTFAIDSKPEAGTTIKVRVVIPPVNSN
jgi:PAS domain S-box-containing protein